MSNITLSIVIPVRNNSSFLSRVFSTINSQSLGPDEVIIVDSSTDNTVYELINDLKYDIPIIYHRVNKAYPGRARNIGVDLANGEWVAFLDCKTVPEKDWLERYQHLIQA